MKSAKKLIKILAVFLIIPIIFLCFSGFSVSANAELKHNGKASAVVTIKSELAEKLFAEKLKSRIDSYNLISGDVDMLTVKSTAKIDGGYEVKIAFRRIDKIKLTGDFKLEKFSKFVSAGSMSRDSLEKMERGDLSCTVSAYYDGSLGQIKISRKTSLIVKPYTAQGEAVKLNDFMTAGETAKNDTNLLMLKMFDTANVEKIKIAFPGEIKYYGGESVKAISKSEIEISPLNLTATIIKNKIVIDDNGVETVEPVISVEEIGAMVGYVVFKKSISPLTITFIIVLCVLVLIGFLALYLYFRKAGKKILRMEAENIGEEK